MSLNSWFPLTEEIVIGESDNYLKSVFIGITAPVLNLPRNIVTAVFDETPLLTTLLAFSLLLSMPLAGLLGCVSSNPKNP